MREKGVNRDSEQRELSRMNVGREQAICGCNSKGYFLFVFNVGEYWTYSNTCHFSFIHLITSGAALP